MRTHHDGCHVLLTYTIAQQRNYVINIISYLNCDEHEHHDASIVCSTVCSGWQQGTHESSAVFVYRWNPSVTNFPHKGRVIRKALQWRHNERNGVSGHQPHKCELNRLFRRRSTKTSKLRVTGLCGRNLLVTGEFRTQRASNAENGSIWWRHHCIPVLEHHV